MTNRLTTTQNDPGLIDHHQRRHEAATKFREYAYALPLNDTDIADALDHHLDTALTNRSERETRPLRTDLRQP